MRITQNKTSQNNGKEDECSAIQFPMAPYGCHMKVPFCLEWTTYRHLMPPFGLIWLFLAPYCPFWSSYGSEGPSRTLWTLLGPFWPLMYTFGPYLATLYKQSGFLRLNVPTYFHVTHFGTIGGP